MTTPPPFEALFDRSLGDVVPLPNTLSKTYGTLRLPLGRFRPHVIGNFASTLDGVVSLKVPGRAGGGEITGFDPSDRLLMGILRAVADVVIVGAGTFRAVPRHIWTASHVFPAMAQEFLELRQRLGKSPTPLNVIVTAEGRLDLTLPVFSAGEVPALIVTTAVGARRLARAKSLPMVDVAVARKSGPLTAKSVLDSVATTGRHALILVEGGPHLIGDFFAEGRIDELFLTLAPQIAGRDDTAERPGLVAGRTFAPDRPLWGNLVGVRRGGSLLFLRFGFRKGQGAPRRGPRTRRPRART